MVQKRYNFSEKQVKEMYDLFLGGLSCTQIAKQQGCSAGTVSSYFKKYNFEVINRQNKINISLEDLIKEYSNGKSLSQISKECGNTIPCLSRMLKKAGIEVVNQQNKLRFDENVFDVIDSEEKAYWLGFLFADGCISSHKPNVKKRYQMELTLAEVDVAHLYKFNKFMKYDGDNVKPKPVKYKNEIKMAYRWSINNKHLWETLNNYGCIPNKSLTLQFPNVDIFTDKRLIIHFIRGYFDGDGCISFCDKNHIIPECSVLGSISYLKALEFYTLNCSSNFIKNHDCNNITYVYIINRTKAIAFMYMLYYKSNIYLDRKYKLFLYFKDCRFKAKALELLEGKIGEGWDANPELIADIKMLQQCNA